MGEMTEPETERRGETETERHRTGRERQRQTDWIASHGSHPAPRRSVLRPLTQSRVCGLRFVDFTLGFRVCGVLTVGWENLPAEVVGMSRDEPKRVKPEVSAHEKMQQH